MSNQLCQARGSAAFKLIAQKLDMHIKDFDQDPNTKIRWIWQLIQNAKDAPNRFHKSKIKQQLTDTHFKSSHNGDPFTVVQLHSVVAQYSTKLEKNSKQICTTGKYGTGFITTLILSRVVQLSSVLKIKRNGKKQDDDQMKQVKVVNKRKSKTSKINKQRQQQMYYKRFVIQMDRSYKDRDEQLQKKIYRTQVKLTNIVNEAQIQMQRQQNNEIRIQQQKKQQKNKNNQIKINKNFNQKYHYQQMRNVDSFDTTFSYQINDNNKLDIVQKAIQNVRQLMAYAMLFNQNLTYYQFIDKRNKPKNISFSIEKKSFKQIINGIYLFTYEYKTNYDHKLQKWKQINEHNIISKVYNQKAVAGIPVQINKNNKRLLKVNKKLSTLFKDFPLIGSDYIKWNAIINSNQFYPNQKRSGLMLKNIDESNKQKVKINQQNLIRCFEGVKDLYKFLGQYYCQQGYQNLLIFNHENKLTQQYTNLSLQLKKNINQIVNTKYIPTVSKKLDKIGVIPKQLIFIEFGDNELKKQELKILSKKLNSQFKYLYGDYHILAQEYYDQFYDQLNKTNNRNYLVDNNIIKFVSLQDCLQKMQQINYKKFRKLFGKQSINKLHSIYKIITQSTLSTIYKYKIYLNNNNEFRQCINDETGDKMMIKQISPVLQQLGNKLNIQINDFIINEQFTNDFIKNKNNKIQKFDIKKLQYKIINKMRQQCVIDLNHKLYTQEQKLNSLILLYKLILTLNINNKIYKKLKLFKIFTNIQSFQFKFKLNIKQLQKINHQTKKQLQSIFVNQFTNYFKRLFFENNHLNTLILNFSNLNIDTLTKYLEDLFNDSILGQHLSSFNRKITLNNHIVNQYQIYQLNNNVEYPNQQDIHIYNLLKKNMLLHNQIDIQQKLISPIYPLNQIKNIRTIDYNTLYHNVKTNYISLSLQKKGIILKYVEQIHNQTKSATCFSNTLKQKQIAWKDFIQNRVSNIFQLKKSMDAFKSQDIKDFLYNLINNQTQLQNAAQAFVLKNRNPQFIAQICSQTHNQPKKKVKKD